MKRTLLSEYVKSDIEFNKKRGIYKNVREYAKHIGVSHTFIHEILNGKHDSPTITSAANICSLFKLEPDELCKMITNTTDSFKEELNKRLLGEDYDKSCRLVLDGFFNKHENKELHSGTVFAHIGPYFESFSILNQKYNKKKTSQYINDYDALADVLIYDVSPVEESDQGGCECICKIVKQAECAYYYLPVRRVYDIKSDHYKDEFIRDFVNKFISIINNPKAPKNNIFVTPSDNVFHEIVKFTLGNGMLSKYGVGVGLVCSRFNRFDQWHVIVENDSIINYPLED